MYFSFFYEYAHLAIVDLDSWGKSYTIHDKCYITKRKEEEERERKGGGGIRAIPLRRLGFVSALYSQCVKDVTSLRPEFMFHCTENIFSDQNLKTRIGAPLPCTPLPFPPLLGLFDGTY